MSLNIKTLRDISWRINEPEYRAYDALSQSMIGKFDKGGFKEIPNLNKPVSSPSITFGKAVDTLITSDKKDFDKQFVVLDIEKPSESITAIVDYLFENYKDTFTTMDSMPIELLDKVAVQFNYYNNRSADSKAKLLKEKGGAYYIALCSTKGKEVLTVEQYQKINATVNTLKSHPTISPLINNLPFQNPAIEKFFQLKFRGKIDGVEYKVMLDLIIVDHEKKIISLYDLKTTSKPEYEFYKSFIEWRYNLQAELYTKIVEENIKKDLYYKDYKVEGFTFIVINSNSLNPLLWKTDPYSTKTIKDRSLRSVFDLGKELHRYLTTPSEVPEGISLNTINNIDEWIEKI